MVNSNPQFKPCPLCNNNRARHYYHCTRSLTDYFSCPACELIFVPAVFHLSPEDERAIYDQHNNDPGDPRYRAFLNRLAAPVISRLTSKPAKGLDFGSGPGPTLSSLFETAGHECANFDKFYANDTSALKTNYDYICSSEVIEHLRDPAATLHMLFSILRPKGILGIMTKLYYKEQEFAGWYYKNDPTHIAFYSEKTMHFIADKYNKTAVIIEPDIVLFQSPD